MQEYKRCYWFPFLPFEISSWRIFLYNQGEKLYAYGFIETQSVITSPVQLYSTSRNSLTIPEAYIISNYLLILIDNTILIDKLYYKKYASIRLTINKLCTSAFCGITRIYYIEQNISSKYDYSLKKTTYNKMINEQ